MVRSLQRNESLTNIDFRNNECFDKQLKFRLSLIMIRNIDKLRSQGTMVQGAWLNKNVLMLEETITSAAQSRMLSPKSQISLAKSHKKEEGMDSIFNIELSDVTKAKDLMSSTYLTTNQPTTNISSMQTRDNSKSHFRPVQVIPKGQVKTMKPTARKKGPIKCNFHELKPQFQAAQQPKVTTSLQGQPGGFHKVSSVNRPGSVRGPAQRGTAKHTRLQPAKLKKSGKKSVRRASKTAGHNSDLRSADDQKSILKSLKYELHEDDQANIELASKQRRVDESGTLSYHQSQRAQELTVDQEDKDAPFTSASKREFYEKLDDDKNRYLIFKSLSGIDSVPRIRDPTPEKDKDKKKADRADLSDTEDPNCTRCPKYKQKYQTLRDENEQLKMELIKAYELMDKERLVQKLNAGSGPNQRKYQHK